MKIGTFDVTKKVLVIAEIGNNHEGDFQVARELVANAAEAGADAVKVQVFRTEHYVSHENQDRFKRLKSFELSFDQFAELAAFAKSCNLLFIATPFDLESASFLDNHVDAFKVASGDNLFFPLLRRIKGSDKPFIVSTGASDPVRVERCVQFLREDTGSSALEGRLALLHCVSAYPAPDNELNLIAIQTLAGRYPFPIGYSDHTLSIDACLTAVALGARIIEKHFTLSKSYSAFRDHQLSADPADLAELVRKVRTVSAMRGDGEKSIQPCEREIIPAVQRSIVSARELPAGHTLNLADLTWVRPEGGLPPGDEQHLLGKRLRESVGKGVKLRFDHFE